MAITDYTSYAEIRGVLGVSDDELEDTTLSLDVFADNLVMELEGISTSLPDEYATVSDILEDDRTAVQQRFYRLTRLFSTYAVGKQLGSSLPMFGPKDITDGKASISRFADSPYRTVQKEIRDKYDDLRAKLAEAYATLSYSTATVTRRVMMAGVSLSTDPVTGS